ncbi:MAG TPA: RING finger protein, partial [Anaerolineae bacterium]
ECALCKQPLAPGDEAVICPQDGSRHHTYCWRANDSKCSAYGCRGQGEIRSRPVRSRRPYREPRIIEFPRTANRQRQRSKVLVRPTSHLGCAQTCLLLSIVIAIVLFSIACFGLWAIADYIMIDVLNWHYRSPLSDLAPAFAIVANTCILL